MTERINKQDHSFIQLHKDIAVSLNEIKGLEEAMRFSVQRVCEETGWPVGHIYFPAIEMELLGDTESKSHLVGLRRSASFSSFHIREFVIHCPG